MAVPLAAGRCGHRPLQKQRAFSAFGAMPTKTTCVPSVGGDALIAPWGASPERLEKTNTPVPLAAGRCGHRPLRKTTCVFSVGGVTHKNNMRPQRRARCPHRPVGYDARAVRKNGHAYPVSFRADVGIGPYENFWGARINLENKTIRFEENLQTPGV